MTPRQLDGLQRWLPTLGTILAIGIAWGLLTAAVEGKADLTDVQRLEYKVDALIRMGCVQKPTDSICPK